MPLRSAASLVLPLLLGSATLQPARTAPVDVGLPLPRFVPSSVTRLPAGTFPQATTLRIGPESSGTPDRPTVIEGAPGGGTRITGSRRLVGWTRDPSRPDLWTTLALDAEGRPWRFRQLFLDGRRLQRARIPDSGHLTARGRLHGSRPIHMPVEPGLAKPEWATPDAELHVLTKWTDMHVPLRAVDVASNELVFPGGPLHAWMDEPDARFAVENIAEALDQPLEWRNESATGRVWLLGREGFDPNRETVSVPVLDTVVRIEGSPGNPVHDVVLRNLVFAESDYALPEEGRISPQAAVEVRGSLQGRHAERVALKDCTLTQLAGYGLDLGAGCRAWTVRGNEFSHLGAGGLRIGEPGRLAADSGPDGPVTAEACHSHVVEDNRLVSLGRIFPPACGILVFHSASNRIAHNHLSDLFYTAISVGWTWGYEPSPCHHNVIEANHAHDIGQGLLSDMGGIYTLGPQPGTVIRGNLFHDIQSHRYGGWALYTDEGSTGILVEDNVVYRCKDAGFHQHYGRDNVVRNNLIVDNVHHSVMRTRSEPHLSFRFERNVVVGDGRKWLGSDWSGSTNQFLNRSNLWWDPSGLPASGYRFGKDGWDAWQARGQDVGSLVADPMLVDREHPERGLREGSPAYALGFRAIDMKEVGPRIPTGAR